MRDVSGNLVEPGCEGAAWLIARDTIERSQEGLLDGVLDVGLFGQVRGGHGVDRAQIATHELFQRVSVSLLHPLRQNLIGRFAGAAPGLRHAEPRSWNRAALRLTNCPIHPNLAADDAHWRRADPLSGAFALFTGQDLCIPPRPPWSCRRLSCGPWSIPPW